MNLNGSFFFQEVPCARDLIRAGGAPCSVGDLMRMESVILNKLDWNISQIVTAIHFLYTLYPHSFEEGQSPPLPPAQHLQHLTALMRFAVISPSTAVFRPSLIAVVMLNLHFELFQPLSVNRKNNLLALVKVRIFRHGVFE